MTPVMNDSDPEAAENKQVNCYRAETEAEEEEKETGERRKMKFKILGLLVMVTVNRKANGEETDRGRLGAGKRAQRGEVNEMHSGSIRRDPTRKMEQYKSL